MKKICFVTTVSLTLKAFVVNTAKYLHEQGGYDITFICAPDEEFQASLPEYIHFIPVPMERGISLGGIGALLRMIRIFKKEKFDLVQYSTPNAAFYASIASKIAKIPVRLYCQWGIAYTGFHGIKRKIFKVVEKMVCSRSTWIEPDSHGNLDFSHAEGLYPESKGSVIWNGSASGVDLNKFNFENREQWRRQIREKYNLPENAFVYGAIGRINRDKGINELFTAFRSLVAEHPDAYLMLVGSEENIQLLDQELYAWAKSHDHVLFCGHTNVVEQYLAAIDTYILPSYREGFGCVVIEAASMGLPVIVSDIPGPTNAMLRDKTGLVVPKADAEALAAAMVKILENPGLCQEFGEAGRIFATENFEQLQLFAHILKDRQRLLREG